MYLPTFLLDSASNSFFYLHFHSFCSSWNTLYVVYRANAFCFGAAFLPHPLFKKNPIIIWYYSTCTQVAIDCFFDPTFWPGSCLVLFFQTLNNSKVFFFQSGNFRKWSSSQFAFQKMDSFDIGILRSGIFRISDVQNTGFPKLTIIVWMNCLFDNKWKIKHTDMGI